MKIKETIKRVLCAAVCVIMLLGCMACSQGLSHSTLKGTWVIYEGHQETTFSNGNFRIDYPGDPDGPLKGTYEIKDGDLILDAEGTEKCFADVKISGDQLTCLDEYGEDVMTWRKK